MSFLLLGYFASFHVLPCFWSRNPTLPFISSPADPCVLFLCPALQLLSLLLSVFCSSRKVKEFQNWNFMKLGISSIDSCLSCFKTCDEWTTEAYCQHLPVVASGHAADQRPAAWRRVAVLFYFSDRCRDRTLLMFKPHSSTRVIFRWELQIRFDLA